MPSWGKPGPMLGVSSSFWAPGSDLADAEIVGEEDHDIGSWGGARTRCSLGKGRDGQRHAENEQQQATGHGRTPCGMRSPAVRGFCARRRSQ